MKICVIILVSIMSWSCSHYKPLHLGKGKYTKKEVVSCSHKILGFPTEPDIERIDVSLSRAGLTLEDIYSVERRVWPYLFPVYMNSCTVLSLNESGAKKIKNSKAISKEKSSKNLLTEKGEFSDMKTFKDCDQFMSLTRSRCREAVYQNSKK